MTTETWVRMCLGKHRWSTIERAESKLPFIEKKFGKKMRIYYCSSCQGYHITSQVRRK